MAEHDPALGEALKLEQSKFMLFISDAANQREVDLRASAQNMAARGLGISGPKHKAGIEIIFAPIESVADKVIAYRAELGRKVPGLLEPASLEALKLKLHNYVDGGVMGLHQRPMLHMPEPSVQAFYENGGTERRKY